jgi:prepilin-type N-terminal cleavage/methylation domain-containing protein
MYQRTKGFTLIELLIVIGILAVLATITVLVLNPAQLFAQARDSQRLSDLGSIKGAISLYLTTKTSPLMAPGTAGNICGSANNYWGTIAGATENFSGSPTQSTQVARTTDGTGWIPVQLDLTTGGSPLSTLPIDPANPNTATQAYTYQCNAAALTFEIDANMESQRYAQSGTDDVESTDGGDTASIYEVGIDPGLNL